MSAITITITDTRALTVEGRLVAGETAEVSIGGATPTALYLVAPDQTVIAACEAFTPTGQGTGGTGFLQLATEQVAALFAQTPAGRMVAVWALVNDADGVAGAGWIPVVSAPMPDSLIDLDIDFYLRASQVGTGLAIVDGKLVCTVSPTPGLTGVSQNGVPITPVGGVADIDAPLNSSLAIPYAEGGAFAVGSYCTYGGALWRCITEIMEAKPWDINDWELVVVSDALATIPAVVAPTASAQTGQAADASQTYAALLLKADAADLRYALGETITASAQLADRTGNRVVPPADNTANIVLTFPDAVAGYLRDFLVLVTNTAGNTGSIAFTPPTGATVYGDGFTNSPAIGETWLYSVTEVAANTFWAKSVKMEVAQ